MADGRVTERLKSPVVWALSLAAVAVVAAAWLSSRAYVGDFGVTGQSKSCGSVWELMTGATGDLNAATCKPELLDRLTLVGVLLGVAGIAVGVALLLLNRGYRDEDSKATHPVAVAAAVAVPCVLSVAFVALGRHLAWSVSGY